MVWSLNLLLLMVNLGFKELGFLILGFNWRPRPGPIWNWGRSRPVENETNNLKYVVGGFKPRRRRGRFSARRGIVFRSR